jgi:formate dehydrogenase maturation protein FdhE
MEKFLSIREQYTKILADSITVAVEDLSHTEIDIINKSFEMFTSKLDEIKANTDEIKRLSLELANTKAMNNSDDARYEYKQTGICPTCGNSDGEDENI